MYNMSTLLMEAIRYKRLIADHPNIMAQLTINISGIISQYAKNNTIALTTPRGYYSALNIHNAQDKA